PWHAGYSAPRALLAGDAAGFVLELDSQHRFDLPPPAGERDRAVAAGSPPGAGLAELERLLAHEREAREEAEERARALERDDVEVARTRELAEQEVAETRRAAERAEADAAGLRDELEREREARALAEDRTEVETLTRERAASRMAELEDRRAVLEGARAELER